MSKVSVIIATRNRPNFLLRAIRSAREAGKDAEIIVVDDASTKETFDVCTGLPNIRYVRLDRNRKLGGARNIGILASTSEYISFLDDDDARIPGSLDVQVEALNSAPEAGFVYGKAFHGDNDCVPLGSSYPDSCPQGDIFWKLMEWNFVPCAAVVFRRSCLFRVGLLADGLSGVEDWDLWLRIAALYPVVAVETPVAIWRQSSPSSGQYTSQPYEMLALCARLLRHRWLRLPRAATAPRSTRLEASRRFYERISDQFIWEAARSLKGGDIDHALKNILTAFRVCPVTTLRKSLRPKSLRFLAAGVSDKLKPRSHAVASVQERRVEQTEE